jgi:hypothetical protein
MSIFGGMLDWLGGVFANPSDGGCDSELGTQAEAECIYNPATGLPLISGCGVDVGGSPYGVDIHQNAESGDSMFGGPHTWPSQSNWDD